MVRENVPRVLFNMQPAGLRRRVSVGKLVRSVARRHGYSDVVPTADSAASNLNQAEPARGSHTEAKGSANITGMSTDSEDELFGALSQMNPELMGSPEVAGNDRMQVVLNEEGFRFGARDNYRDIFVQGVYAFAVNCAGVHWCPFDPWQTLTLCYAFCVQDRVTIVYSGCSGY